MPLLHTAFLIQTYHLLNNFYPFRPLENIFWEISKADWPSTDASEWHGLCSRMRGTLSLGSIQPKVFEDGTDNGLWRLRDVRNQPIFRFFESIQLTP